MLVPSIQLTSVAVSNLRNMAITTKHDVRQMFPETYSIPPIAVRRLRAQLILEEARETIHALGFNLCVRTENKNNPVQLLLGHDSPNGIYDLDEGSIVLDLCPSIDRKPDLEKIIDGCCDTIYVCVGAMLSVGAPDKPHIEAVCRANDQKFPGNVATVDENGKYLKPAGWQPPNHKRFIEDPRVNLVVQARNILAMGEAVHAGPY